MDKLRLPVDRRVGGAYEVREAGADIPEPEWPAENLRSLIEIAFRDKYIDTIDHSVIRRLRGKS